MWDQRDYTARLIQGAVGFCGLVGMFGLLYVTRTSIIFFVSSLAGLWFLGKLCWRSLRYAVTGKGSVNRDEF